MRRSPYSVPRAIATAFVFAEPCAAKPTIDFRLHRAHKPQFLQLVSRYVAGQTLIARPAGVCFGNAAMRARFSVSDSDHCPLASLRGVFGKQYGRDGCNAQISKLRHTTLLPDSFTAVGVNRRAAPALVYRPTVEIEEALDFSFKKTFNNYANYFQLLFVTTVFVTQQYHISICLLPGLNVLRKLGATGVTSSINGVLPLCGRSLKVGIASLGFVLAQPMALPRGRDPLCPKIVSRRRRTRVDRRMAVPATGGG